MDPAEGKNELPCPLCAGSSYTWGDLAAHGISFRAKGASFLSRHLLRVGIALPARRCNTCGNVQLFSAPARQETQG